VLIKYAFIDDATKSSFTLFSQFQNNQLIVPYSGQSKEGRIVLITRTPSLTPAKTCGHCPAFRASWRARCPIQL